MMRLADKLKPDVILHLTVLQQVYVLLSMRNFLYASSKSGRDAL